MSKRLLALDPGSKNTGWSVLEYTDSWVSIIKCGLLSRCVYSIDGFVNNEVMEYAIALKKLFGASKPNDVVCERYMTQIRGKTCETVNIMIGSMIMIAGNRSVTLYPAVTWKNAIKRQWGFKLEKSYYNMVGIPAHPTDATLMGMYWIMQHGGPSIPTQYEQLAPAIAEAFIGAYPKYEGT